MPSTSTTSSKRAPRLRTTPPVSHPRKKELVFGPVEIIADPCNPKPPRPSASAATSNPALRSTGGKLRRSPTPVLTSLHELTNAHLAQLSSVWKEKNLPGFEADKKAIAATRAGKSDPFDF